MTQVQSLIFDRSGTQQLAEISPTIESVSWRLCNTAMAKLFMPYSDAKCTTTNLRLGNRLFFRFDNGLPDWGGVFDLPRKRDGEGVGSTGYTGEKLLDWRVTAKARYFSTASPGYILQTLLDEENTEWATGVLVGEVWPGGLTRTLEYHYHDVLQRFVDMVRLTGHEFAILPSYDETTKALGFYLYWYERRGSDKSGQVRLVEGLNVEKPVVLDEQGEIANKIYTIGEGSTWGDLRLVGESQDAESIDAYGYREYAEMQSAIYQATLDANADALVEALAWPALKFTVKALNVAPATYDAYDVGDIVRLEAFVEHGDWAYDGKVRIIAREWLPAANVCRLEVEEWRE